MDLSPDRRHDDRRRYALLGGRRLTDHVLSWRRRYIYGVPAALFLAAAFLFLWGFWYEPQSLVVRPQTVVIGGWPRTEKPLRVALLADIHGGSPYINEEKIQKIVEMTNAQNPDLTLLLGDYVILGVLGGHFMDPERVAENLKGLKAPLGVYAVLGNHDWWYDGRRIQKALENVGIKVLEDSAVVLKWRGRPISLVGLGDFWTRRPDPAKTFNRLPPGAPVILMTHNPDIFPKLPPFTGLGVAGHTHGGQVNLPFMGAPIVPSRYRQRYAHGLVEQNGQHFFITSGLGTSVLPVRFRVPPEIAVISIASGDEVR